MGMEQLGKTLMMAGAGLLALGLLLWVAPKSPFLSQLGRLPGDFRSESGGVSVYFPFTTMLLLSAAATLVMWLVGWLRR